MNEGLLILLTLYASAGFIIAFVLFMMNASEPRDKPEINTWYWPSPINCKQDALTRVAFLLGYPIVILIGIGILLIRILRWYIKLPDTK